MYIFIEHISLCSFKYILITWILLISEEYEYMSMGIAAGWAWPCRAPVCVGRPTWSWWWCYQSLRRSRTAWPWCHPTSPQRCYSSGRNPEHQTQTQRGTQSTCSLMSLTLCTTWQVRILTAMKYSVQAAVHLVSKTKVICDSWVASSSLAKDWSSLSRRCYRGLWEMFIANWWPPAGIWYTLRVCMCVLVPTCIQGHWESGPHGPALRGLCRHTPRPPPILTQPHNNTSIRKLQCPHNHHFPLQLSWLL